MRRRGERERMQETGKGKWQQANRRFQPWTAIHSGVYDCPHMWAGVRKKPWIKWYAGDEGRGNGVGDPSRRNGTRGGGFMDE